jgi:hypothetical protein
MCLVEPCWRGNGCYTDHVWRISGSSATAIQRLYKGKQPFQRCHSSCQGQMGSTYWSNGGEVPQSIDRSIDDIMRWFHMTHACWQRTACRLCCCRIGCSDCHNACDWSAFEFVDRRKLKHLIQPVVKASIRPPMYICTYVCTFQCHSHPSQVMGPTMQPAQSY